ncbi:recombinase family protein [Acinetobacter pittii]|uniref:recombinase family protein n=1 Tax=Acinetobacter pittii TaxID=48296 RepID=UPI002A034119|nr:recombinase family protein [Acinetobacter pittii]MDX8253721.1 recombinase family protein [Acinetobacter pittii]
MRTYAYFRVDNYDNSNEASYSSLLKEHGYVVQKNRLIIEEVGVDKSISIRGKFNNLISYSMEIDDLLIVKGIDCLGSTYNEILKVVESLEQKGIRLICIDYSKQELVGEIRDFFIYFLKLCLNFENQHQACKAKLKHDSGSHKIGRPEKLTNEQKQQILEKYKKGWSVYRLALDFEVSRTVIQRVLDKESKKNGS